MRKVYQLWRGRGGFFPGERIATVVGVTLIAILTLTLAVVVDKIAFDAVLGLVTLLALVSVSIPALNWLARRESAPEVTGILYWGMGFTVFVTLANYFTITILYNDAADPSVYSEAAASLSRLYRAGAFTMVPPGLEARPSETQRVAVVLALVYLATGVSRWAGSFVFAWLAFGGRLLMWRALKSSLPEADHRRYLILLMFFPSLVFWPGSIGKEALMMLALGIVSYGAAQMFSDRVKLTSILTFSFGVGCLLFIRPHMAAIAVASLGLASVVGTLGGLGRSNSLRSIAIRTTSLVVLVVVAAFVLTQTGKFFDEDGQSSDAGVTSVLDKTTETTSTGGSQFAAPSVNSPLDLPWATVTVFFRPFPWEAAGFNGLVSSAEGVVLLGLLAANYRRFASIPRLILKRPYILFVASFVVVFIVAFSYIANFGILVRQRTQMLPLLLVYVALPAWPRARGLFGGSAHRPARAGGTTYTTDQGNGSGETKGPVNFAAGVDCHQVGARTVESHSDSSALGPRSDLRQKTVTQ